MKALLALWEQQGRLCAITGLPIDGAPQLDHKLPVSIGGTNSIENLQWVSKMANFAKNSASTKEVRDWILAAADSIRSKGLS